MTEPFWMSKPWGGIDITPAPLEFSTDFYIAELRPGRLSLLCMNISAALAQIHGARWHDRGDHCPTWTGGFWDGACRCDLGDEA